MSSIPPHPAFSDIYREGEIIEMPIEKWDPQSRSNTVTGFKYMLTNSARIRLLSEKYDILNTIQKGWVLSITTDGKTDEDNSDFYIVEGHAKIVMIETGAETILHNSVCRIPKVRKGKGKDGAPYEKEDDKYMEKAETGARKRLYGLLGIPDVILELSPQERQALYKGAAQSAPSGNGQVPQPQAGPQLVPKVTEQSFIKDANAMAHLMKLYAEDLTDTEVQKLLNDKWPNGNATVKQAMEFLETVLSPPDEIPEEELGPAPQPAAKKPAPRTAPKAKPDDDDDIPF